METRGAEAVMVRGLKGSVQLRTQPWWMWLLALGQRPWYRVRLAIDESEIAVHPTGRMGQLLIRPSSVRADEVADILCGNDVVNTEVRVHTGTGGWERQIRGLHVDDPREVTDRLLEGGYQVRHGASWQHSPPPRPS